MRHVNHTGVTVFSATPSGSTSTGGMSSPSAPPSSSSSFAASQMFATAGSALSSVVSSVPANPFRHISAAVGWTNAGERNRLNDLESGEGSDHAGGGSSYFGTLQETFDICGGLTFQQRIAGFLMSLAMGVAFIVIALSFVPLLALFPKKFAFFFTCGNAFAVGATSFLVGPRSQLKAMFEAHRAQAATAYLVSLFATLVAALHWRSAILSILFAAVQIAAVVWYALSFVPYARRVVSWSWSYLSMILPVCSACSATVWACCSRLPGVCSRWCCA